MFKVEKITQLKMEEILLQLVEQMRLDGVNRDAQMAQKDEQMKLLIEQLTNQRQDNYKDLSERIEKFVYSAEENATFDLWYARYSTIFTVDAAKMTDAARMDLLTEKLCHQDYAKFANTILPLTKANIPFADGVNELKRIFGRKESQFALRYKCLKIEMEASEEFESYAARVNLNCEKFDTARCTPDDFKVLMFVQGLNKPQHSLVLEKLLTKLDEQEKRREAAADPTTVSKLKLQDVVNFATRVGSLKIEKSMVTSPSHSTEVNAVHKKTNWNDNKQQTSSGHQQASSSTVVAKFPCRMCGEIHLHKDCPFQSKECFTCKAPGHKAGYCESAASWKRRGRRGSRDFNPKKSLAVQTLAMSTRKYVEPEIDERKVKLQLDSGSDWTIISKANWRAIGSPTLSQCEEQAVSASGDPVDMVGKFNGRVKLHGRESVGACYVAASELNVLGSDWMEALDLWSVPIANVCNKLESAPISSLEEKVKGKFPKLFKDSLGLCNKTQASLTLKEGSKPIYRKSRPVPFAAAEPIASELKRLQLMGVISPIDFAEYAAPIVAVKKKDGRVRICADYSTGLNDSLEPNKHPLPTPEEIFTKLSQYRVFSKIDLSDAFLQVELDDEAKKLWVVSCQSITAWHQDSTRIVPTTHGHNDVWGRRSISFHRRLHSWWSRQHRSRVQPDGSVKTH